MLMALALRFGFAVNKFRLFYQEEQDYFEPLELLPAPPAPPLVPPPAPPLPPVPLDPLLMPLEPLEPLEPLALPASRFWQPARPTTNRLADKTAAIVLLSLVILISSSKWL